ncbi:amidase [Sulfolobales archaeon HS-7]|nr:amidase [Sulfolobales archaeon HS-7]
MDSYNAVILPTEIKRGEGPLSHLTFAVKDVIHIKGLKTTACSRILSNYIANSDSYIVDLILNKGGEIIGKTNTHEFAIGATNTSSTFGPVKNPNDVERISGGSSGGSAVAVKAKIADVGIGTDTGGSVRIPSALCGTIGFKPTTGIIPIHDIIPFSRTLDTIGFISRVSSDIKVVISNIVKENVNFRKKKSETLRKLTVLPMMFDSSKTSEIVLKRASEIFNIIEEKVIQEDILVSLRRIRRIIASYEGAKFHERWLKTMSDKYFPDVRDALLDGLNITQEEYNATFRELVYYKKIFEGVMSSVDYIISPTVPITAPKISDVIGHEKEYRRILVSNTEIANILGLPSISVPVGILDGLPVGLMITGKQFSDLEILDIAVFLE